VRDKPQRFVWVRKLTPTYGLDLKHCVTTCGVPDDYIGTKIGSLLRAREIMELLVSTSVPENAQ